MRRIIAIITQCRFSGVYISMGMTAAYRGGQTDRQGYPDCQVNEAGIRENGSEPPAENSS